MMNSSRSGRGRRPGPTETREAVLKVARRRVLAEGYQAVTMRSVAEEVGVDAALISYFFGSKRGLFGASLDLDVNPPEVLAGALDGDPATLPERLLHGLVQAWEDPVGGTRLRVLVGAAIQDPETGRLFREVIEREMIERLVTHLGGADARARAAAVGVQLAGLVFARYVLVEPTIASMDRDELIRCLLPGLRAALAPRGRPAVARAERRTPPPGSRR